MDDIQVLRNREQELLNELEVIKEKIHFHPITIKKRIEDGIKEFSKLISLEKHKSKIKKEAMRIMTESLADYEIVLDLDKNDIKPGQHYIHRFYLEDDFTITVGIFLEAGHSNYEMSLNFKGGDNQINIMGFESSIESKIQSIDQIMKFVPAYVYYKHLVLVFVKLLYVDLLDDYFKNVHSAN